MRHWNMVLIGEELASKDATGTATLGAPMTFATIENALDWLLESPSTRDVRVTAVSKQRPVRHVVGRFVLDPDLDLERDLDGEGS